MRQTISSISKVQEFDFSVNFRSFPDERSLELRIFHIVEAVFRMLAHLFKILYRFLFFSPDETLYPTPTLTDQGQYCFDLSNLPWKDDTSSEGLYLFIHGLGGKPWEWMSYIEALNPNIHRLAPHVPSAGFCSLENEEIPLMPILEDYLKKFPGAPLHLIGTSNGGRIASHLETHLSPELIKGRSLSVISIAGVHGGTVLIDSLKQLGVASLLHPGVIDSLSYNSLSSQNLLKQWQDKQYEWHRHDIKVRHCFYATREDEMIWPISSALPFLPHTQVEDYHVFHGYSHLTLLDGVREDIFARYFSSAAHLINRKFSCYGKQNQHPLNFRSTR